MERNEPLLVGESAPWDPESPIGLRRPRDIWRRIQYVRRYGTFWAPVRIEAWRYRKFLRDLDRVCLRALKCQGALTARGLAETLNRDKPLRTNPKATGIRTVSVATAHDWLVLASQRGLVTGSSLPSRAASSQVPWQPTDRGQDAVRPTPWVVLDRFSALLLALIAGGLFLGTLEWLALHPGILAWMLVLGVELAAFSYLWIRSEKREASGVAIVAIESLRCAGRPIPPLHGR